MTQRRLWTVSAFRRALRGHTDSKPAGPEAIPLTQRCHREPSSSETLVKQQPLATSWWPSDHSIWTSLRMKCGNSFTPTLDVTPAP